MNLKPAKTNLPPSTTKKATCGPAPRLNPILFRHGRRSLADLCGLGAPSGLEGISMAPLLRDPNRPWKKGAFTCMGNGTSVRTEHYRYNEWGGPEQAELYDHETDPRELRNLAKDPKFKEVVTELSALIKGGWKAALPAP